jgi:hypothetical protein
MANTAPKIPQQSGIVLNSMIGPPLAFLAHGTYRQRGLLFRARPLGNSVRGRLGPYAGCIFINSPPNQRRSDGVVRKLMGDDLMALFGAPLALEDHAIRVCYAGPAHTVKDAALISVSATA